MMPPHFLQANLKARTASTASEGVSRERHYADELGPVEYLVDSPAQKAKPKEINMSDNQNTRIKRLGYRPPLDVAEPDQLVVDE